MRVCQNRKRGGGEFLVRWCGGRRFEETAMALARSFGTTKTGAERDHAKRKRKVCILKVGGEVATDYGKDLVSAVNALKEMNMWPVIVHGAGPQLNKRLEEANVEVDYVDGMRVTDPVTLGVARRVFLETNDLIVSDLYSGTKRLPGKELKDGGLPRPVTSGIFLADLLDEDTWGLVGDVTKVHTESILSAIENDCVPVITCMGETSSGQILNINADVAAVKLAAAMSSQVAKLVFVSSAGGLKNEKGDIIPEIDLDAEFDEYMSQDWVKYGTRLKLKQFHELLNANAPLGEVTVTSPGTTVQAARADAIDGNDPRLGTVVYKGSKIGKRREEVSAIASSKENDANVATRNVRVGLLGARGYVGRELLRLIDQHPRMRVDACVSRSLDGTPVSDLVPGLSGDGGVPRDLVFTSTGGDDPKRLAELYKDRIDCWVLAMPNGVAAPFVEALQDSSSTNQPLLIDLSADYRFNDDWVYGLPERKGQRELLRSARRISNPGCYATGAQMALFPLVNAGLVASPPSVFGVSGYSGAGTTPSTKNDVEFLSDNLVPYSLTNHIHEREVSDQLQQGVHFMPHVAPFFQGISLTCNVQLSERTNRDDLAKLFADYYEAEPLVGVVSDPSVELTVKTHGSYRHGVTLGGFTTSPDSDRVVVVSLIDNLLKGAATQCLQNMNLALGMSEYEGIPMDVREDGP